MVRKSTFRIVYHIGAKPDLSTKMLAGRAEIDATHLEINGQTKIRIPLSEIRDAELFRFQASMRMISFRWKEQSFFLAVVRINIGGYFAIGNYFGAGRLFNMIEQQSGQEG